MYGTRWPLVRSDDASLGGCILLNGTLLGSGVACPLLVELTVGALVTLV